MIGDRHVLLEGEPVLLTYDTEEGQETDIQTPILFSQELNDDSNGVEVGYRNPDGRIWGGHPFGPDGRMALRVWQIFNLVDSLGPHYAGDANQNSSSG